MARSVPPYAKRIVKTLRSDQESLRSSELPFVDTAEVIRVRGGVQVVPTHGHATYDEDDLIWNIDPESVKVGDQLTIGRDPIDNPIVLGLVDAMQPDPALHPTHKKLRREFDDLKGHTKTWKQPVDTTLLLPNKGNKEGDVRLVLGTGELYYWNETITNWVIIGVSSLPNASLDDLNDVVITNESAGQLLSFNGTNWVNTNTISASLSMTSGTHITLPDAPVHQTDAVNKAYVDSLVASVLGVTITPTAFVGTGDSPYLVLPTDQAIIANVSAGPLTIILPANHTNGTVYEIKDETGTSDIHNITVISADGDLIDGLPTTVLNTTYQMITLVSDGTNWYII